MLRANLKSSKNYEGAYFDKLKRTLLLLEETINSSQFEKAVLNFKTFQFVRYKCFLKVKLQTTYLQKFTNEEIYDILMKGHRQEGEDSFMDLQLLLSNASDGSAIGETDGNDITTTYRNAFDRMNEGQLAAHITHEWTHTLGFEHSFSNKCDPTRDCMTVPYAIGNIIEIITTGQCWYDCRYDHLTP